MANTNNLTVVSGKASAIVGPLTGSTNPNTAQETWQRRRR